MSEESPANEPAYSYALGVGIILLVFSFIFILGSINAENNVSLSIGSILGIGGIIFITTNMIINKLQEIVVVLEKNK